LMPQVMPRALVASGWLQAQVRLAPQALWAREQQVPQTQRAWAQEPFAPQVP